MLGRCIPELMNKPIPIEAPTLTLLTVQS